MERLSLASSGGGERPLSLYAPEGEAKAALLIVHGMAEHHARYRPLAEFLQAQGIAVAAYDHLGHGPDTPKEQLGWLGEGDGWQHLVDDAGRALALLKERFPGLPCYILGHSMGSFVVREYLLNTEGKTVTGAVLSGTGWQPRALCAVGVALSHLVCLLGSERKPSLFLHRMAFAANNRGIDPQRTALDWLSRDEAQVDRYIADPYCGFPFTGGGYRAFFRGLYRLCDLRRLEALPKDLPILLISGDQDPVGSQGAGVKAVAKQYQDAGLKDITLKLYPGARHEIFNEVNRAEAMADLLAWLLRPATKEA